MGKPQVVDNADDKDSFVDELKPGTKLMHGQYTIESFLNAGGFGITYLAKDSLDRKIVIKECFPGAFCRRSRYVVQARSRAHQNELKSIVRLFVQEARSLAKLNHPNIVGVHQVFEDNDTAYMALDFVEGRDLLDTIEDPTNALTATQVKSILKEVLGAVGFIHEQGILHRDISPDNILINKQFRPVLIDFGAAREEATKQSRVLSALRVVKDGYSPQEFYIAGSEQSPSSDLYALAASFYHLITKDVPPNSQARLAAIASSENDPYEPLVGRFPEYEEPFLAAIDKALAVLPKDRLQTAKAWLDMIDGTQGNVTPLNVSSSSAEPAAAHSAASAPAVADAPKSKMPILLASVAAVSIVAVGGFMMMGGSEGAPAPQTATSSSTSTSNASTPATATPAPAPVIVEETPDVPDGPVILELEPSTSTQTASAEPLPEPAVTPRPEIAEPATDAAFPDLSGNRPAADNESAEVALPPTPSSVSEIGTGPDVEIDAVAPGNELPAPVVESNWAVQLPFEAEAPGSAVIGSAGMIAPVWVRPGIEITSVNGVEVASIDQIASALRNAEGAFPGETMELTFDYRDPGNDAEAEGSWVVPVVQETTMRNGVVFTTSFDGSDWITTVAKIPADVTTDLRVGDQLTLYIPTSESIETRDMIAAIVAREAVSGTEQMMFAVQREGSMWVASLNLEGI